MNAFLHDSLRGLLPSRFVGADDLPWIPSSTPGKWAKPLRFLGDRGFVELLRMDPGVVIPLHRHTGEVHVLNLAGHRQLCTGETIGPGDYVHEPAGHVDWWKAVGDVQVIALAVVMGGGIPGARRRGARCRLVGDAACGVRTVLPGARPAHPRPARVTRPVRRRLAAPNKLGGTMRNSPIPY